MRSIIHLFNSTAFSKTGVGRDSWAADPKRKYPFLVTFLSSADLVARYHNSYRERARQYGYEAAPDQLGWAYPIYVAEDAQSKPYSTIFCAKASRC